jgi:hypothetical protein
MLVEDEESVEIILSLPSQLPAIHMSPPSHIVNLTIVFMTSFNCTITTLALGRWSSDSSRLVQQRYTPEQHPELIPSEAGAPCTDGAVPPCLLSRWPVSCVHSLHNVWVLWRHCWEVSKTFPLWCVSLGDLYNDHWLVLHWGYDCKSCKCTVPAPTPGLGSLGLWCSSAWAMPFLSFVDSTSSFLLVIKPSSLSVLYTPPPVLLDSDRTARSPSGVWSDSVHCIELYFEVYFPSGVWVESEWSPSGPIYSMLFKQFYKLLLCCDISPIRLHSDWIGTYNLLLKLVSENVKAQFWQALNPHPLH